MHAKRHRCVDAQAPAGGSQALRGHAFGRFDLGQDDLDAFVEGLARLGEVLAPRGAVKQAHAQVQRQRLHMLAHHLRRQLQRLGRRRKRARFHGPGEDLHAQKAVHLK